MNHPTEWLEQLNETHSKTLNAILSLGELTSQTVEKLAQREFELANSALQEGLEQIQSLGQVSSLEEFMQRQQGLLSELNDRWLAQAKLRMDLLAEAQDDYSRWLDRQLAGLRPAAPVARPAPKRAAARKPAAQKAAA
ncbi:MAG TPA: phasin family protein [Gammaproteobacteria bacterium]